MESIIETMLSTWRHAASDLAFKFTAPLVLRGRETEIECFGHLPEFGSPNGMVVFTAFNAEHCKLAQAQGFAYSCVSLSPEPYDRRAFIEMLNDWGWSVANREPPLWYTGQPWSS